ncbi:MAG TPA: hypothetical protein VIJ14_04150, partial [Rhabdochlamydiaceae bacterium]
MIAFHGKQETKDFYMSRIKAHALADEIIKGQYWEGGKGCAVGCTIHGSTHKDYEIELGIPEWLARLEDALFENISDEKAKQWPVQFLEAINIGSDLEKVKKPFLIFILKNNLKTLDSLKVDPKFDAVIKSIEASKAATLQMIDAHEKGLDLEAARSAAESAGSAAESAESAAES